MTPNQIEKVLEIKTYSIAHLEIALYQDPDVWLPYSATEMLNFLIQNNYLSSLKDNSVLDLGTGSGIIGIACEMLGATNVILGDYCAAAVVSAEQNAQLNRLHAKGVQSDRFASFSGQAFDLIISNPPVQPWLFTDTSHRENRLSTSAWNEAGYDGRLVLDALICESKNLLSHQGQVITSCSSRHGHRQTLALLEQYWANQWEEIFVSEHIIDPNYHKPYMNIWLKLQDEDLDLRVYQKDGEGRKYAFQKDNKRAFYLLTEWEIAGDLIPVKIYKELDSYRIFNQNKEKILDLTEEDYHFPELSLAQPWYYTYHLLRLKI
ncbi:MAG: methyltransferase [Microscillaceae bacterium]|nr:methyltransferase [Microscillaceae bacterium]